MRRAAVLAVFLLGACSPQPPKIVAGSKVSVRYTLWVDDKFVESNEQGKPLTFTAGRGEVVAGLDEGLRGLSAGAEKRLFVPAEEGYGTPDRGAVQRLPLTAFSGLQVALAPGMKVQGLRNGKAAEAKVLRVDGGEVTLDFNHPLAGKTLDFRVRVLSVE